MTDLEITRLCAEAMKETVKVLSDGTCWTNFSSGSEKVDLPYPWEKKYEPLINDTQAMALVKKFGLNIAHYYWDDPEVLKYDAHQQLLASARNKDLNRAICECVAKLKQGEDG